MNHDGELEFWDTRTRRPLGEPQSGACDPAPGGDLQRRRPLAGDRRRRLRSCDSGTRAAAPRGATNSIAPWPTSSLSPDGTTLAVTLESPELQRRPGDPLRPGPRADQDGATLPIGTVGRFSPDGRSLVYGARDGRVWTLDTRTWRPRGRPIHAHPAFSPPISAPTVACSRRPPPTAPAASGTSPPAARSAPRCPAGPATRSARRSSAESRHLAVDEQTRRRRMGRPSRRRGHATLARSPDARSRATSGTARSPSTTTRPRVYSVETPN